MSDALRYIDEHYREELGLATLAAVANMSKYHFLRTFRSAVGSTPHQYLIDVRLRRCAVRLRMTRDSIVNVAADAGFADLSTFYRHFRKVFGVSPDSTRARRAA